MVLLADQVIECKPEACSCGTELGAAPGQVVESRQVFDLPEPKLVVREYRRMRCNCPRCGAQVSGCFPAQVNAPVQYGPGVLALGVLLSNACQVSFGKVSLLFADLFGYSVNPASLLRANSQVSEGLRESELVMKAKLENSALAHFDETGLRVEGKLHWLHTCSNEQYSYLFVDAHRGQKALRGERSILADFTGWAVHDCLGAYFTFTDCKHAICGAHLIRELQALIESGSRWAVSMKELLLSLYQHSRQGTGKVNTLPTGKSSMSSFASKASGKNPCLSLLIKQDLKRRKGETCWKDSSGIKTPYWLLPDTRLCLLPTTRLKGI